MTDRIDIAKERERLDGLDGARLYNMGLDLLDALDAEREENERLLKVLKTLTREYRRFVRPDDTKANAVLAISQAVLLQHDLKGRNEREELDVVQRIVGLAQKAMEKQNETL